VSRKRCDEVCSLHVKSVHNKNSDPVKFVYIRLAAIVACSTFAKFCIIVDNKTIAHKATRKVRIKQQIIAHLPIFGNSPIAHFPYFFQQSKCPFPLNFFQQSNCAFSFLIALVFVKCAF